MLLGPKDYLDLGNWNAICDVCGGKFKSSELKRRWDGYMVCSSDYEQRHPQDLIRLRPERQATPWVRPVQPIVFMDNLGFLLAENQYPILTESSEYIIVTPGYDNYTHLLDEYENDLNTETGEILLAR
jgi:hypothetical protein